MEEDGLDLEGNGHIHMVLAGQGGQGPGGVYTLSHSIHAGKYVPQLLAFADLPDAAFLFCFTSGADGAPLGPILGTEKFRILPGAARPFLRAKHSLQYTGRLPLGLNGNSVSLPHS